LILSKDPDKIGNALVGLAKMFGVYSGALFSALPAIVKSGARSLPAIRAFANAVINAAGEYRSVALYALLGIVDAGMRDPSKIGAIIKIACEASGKNYMMLEQLSVAIRALRSIGIKDESDLIDVISSLSRMSGDDLGSALRDLASVIDFVRQNSSIKNLGERVKKYIKTISGKGASKLDFFYKLNSMPGSLN